MRREEYQGSVTFVLILLMTIMIGCDEANPVLPEDTIVVQSFLIANRRFNEVRLTRVVTPQQVSEGANLDQPVTGATILLSDELTTFALQESSPGRYTPGPQDTIVVRNTVRYSVVVNAAGRRLSSTTLVPSPVKVSLVDSDSVVRYGYENVVLKIDNDSTVGGFLIVTRIDYDQPFNPSTSGFNYLYAFSSLVTVPWENFLTLGSTTVYVYAFDTNYAEYVRSRRVGNPTQNLFPTSSKISHGFGIFASASLDSIEIDIVP